MEGKKEKSFELKFLQQTTTTTTAAAAAVLCRRRKLFRVTEDERNKPRNLVPILSNRRILRNFCNKKPFPLKAES
ncbi:Hypothetical predicted protein [Octopus vulgaris]|uniref:Uncharacterized protein n=1 Tax=Octopus vulgaris TaxID=6645 RepID=A0AA36BU92_OCTVU|nr:Hypothetical predicted protein [Octopus vulgaris]